MGMAGAKDVTATFPYAYLAKGNFTGNRCDTLTGSLVLLSGSLTVDRLLLL